MHFCDVGAAQIAHAGTQPASQLVNDVHNRTFVGNAAFDTFGDVFVGAVGFVLEVAVGGALAHCTQRTHASVGFVRAALVEFDFARCFFRTGKHTAQHHAVCARCQGFGDVAGEADAAVGTGGDTEERVKALVGAGVDVIVVDTAHGHSQGVIERVKWVKETYPHIQVIGGNIATAKAALDLGLYISFSGIVTFKNAPQIQEAAKYVPADRMLVETDAPFLAPVPKRGKPNEPSYVRYTAEFLAKLRGESVETLAAYTSDNFYRLFNKVPDIRV